MYTVYQVVLSSEDGDYPRDDFQTESAAVDYIHTNKWRYEEGQYLYIKQIQRGF